MECSLNISQLVKQDTRVSPVTTVLTFYVIGSHNSYEIGFAHFRRARSFSFLGDIVRFACAGDNAFPESGR
jgi:hypothetical protein